MKKFLALALLAPTLAFGSPLYYASPDGGLYGGGTVYRLDGHRRTVIYDFCALPACADGFSPLTDILEMEDGSLIGATSAGGFDPHGWQAAGVLFRLEQLPDGTWAQSVLHPFCPFWENCSRFGSPSGSIHKVDENTIDGLIQGDGGWKGVRWRFKLHCGKDGYSTWTPVEYWTTQKEGM